MSHYIRVHIVFKNVQIDFEFLVTTQVVLAPINCCLDLNPRVQVFSATNGCQLE